MTTTYRVELGSRASRRFGVIAVVGCILLAIVPFVVDPSLLVSLTQLIILIALGELWNLLAGYAGDRTASGSKPSVGIGAYATFAFADLAGWNLWLSIALSAVVAVVIAVPTALAASMGAIRKSPPGLSPRPTG